MTIPLETQINTILQAIFGNEVYPIVHPEISGSKDDVTNMFAIWLIVGGSTFPTLEGDSNMYRVRLQVSIYSNDYTELKIAQKAVTAAMQAANQLASDCVEMQTDSFEVPGALSNVSANVPNEGREEDTRRFFSHSEFYVWARG